MADLDESMFLADCGPGVGIGHLRRMLVLAAAFRRRGRNCRFLVTDVTYAAFVSEHGFAADQWNATGPQLPSAKLVVIDGYRFDRALPSRWRSETGATVAVFDDLCDRPVEADVIVNHNLYGADFDYLDYRAGKILAGPEFAVIDRGFASLAGRPRPSPPHVLVSFGGTDDGRYSRPASETVLAVSKDATVDVIIPPHMSPPAALAELESRFADRFRIHRVPPMIQRMEEARLYLGAAGVTVLEAIAAGVDIVACAIASNQRINVRALAKLGYPSFEDFQPALMAKAVLSRLANEYLPGGLPLVDGRGADRIVDEILPLIQSRRVGHGDAVMRS